MKKFVLCVCVLLAFGAAGARADELPDRPPSLVPYSSQPVTQPLWTGFYIGANGGFGWLNTTATFLPTTSAKPPSALKLDGGTAGGQIGYNWQTNIWVFGIEADYQWSHFNGTTVAAQTSVNQSIDSFGTVRGRLGIVPFTRLLLYTTGGLAYGRINESFTAIKPTSTGTLSSEVWGWTLGAGGEYLITNNVAFKAEFLYVNFSLPSARTPSFTVNFNQESFGIVRAGFNFTF